MKKRITALLLTVFSCMMILSGCGSSNADKTSFEYDPQQLMQVTVQNTQVVWEWTAKDAKQQFSNSEYVDSLVSSVDAIAKTREEIGAIKDAVAGKISDDGETVSVPVAVTAENGKANLIFVLDKKGQLESISCEKYQTMGEKLEDAGLNTLIAMSFVFIVLIFISFVIRLIPLITKSFEGKKKEEAAPKAAPAVTPAPSAAPVQAGNDDEIAVVIAAAIRAYEEENNVSADGLVVRSIRRHNANGWKNAE